MPYQENINSFASGMQSDAFPLVTGDNLLTDAVNATLLTYFGNEVSLQAEMGCCRILVKETQQEVVRLTQGFIPLAVKEYAGILYFLLSKGNLIQLGSFPSPDYNHGLGIDDNGNNIYEKLNQYKPLKNLDGGWFETSAMDVSLEYQIQMELQRSYDNSVNIIWTDKVNKTRLVNCGFYENRDGKFVVNKKTYVGDKINNNSLQLTFSHVPKLSFLGCESGGSLPVGTYVAYLYFVDNDGNTTNIIAHSLQITCFKGDIEQTGYIDFKMNEMVDVGAPAQIPNLEKLPSPRNITGGIDNMNSGKIIKLSLTDILDDDYSHIMVKLTRSTSSAAGDVTVEAYRNEHYYEIVKPNPPQTTAGHCNITISDLSVFTKDSLSLIAEDISVSGIPYSIAQIQNRLFEANIKTQSDSTYYALRCLSQRIYTYAHVGEAIGDIYPVDSFPIRDKKRLCYYDPKNIYYYTSYWDTEIYQFGVVFIINGEETPVFYVRGRNGICESGSETGDEPSTLINDFYTKFTGLDDSKDDLKDEADENGFLDQTSMDNIYGVCKFATKNGKVWYRDNVPNFSIIKPYTITPIGVSFYMSPAVLTALNNLNVDGLYFVRKKREPLILAQGFKMGRDQTSGLPALITGRFAGTINNSIISFKENGDLPNNPNISVKLFNYSWDIDNNNNYEIIPHNYCYNYVIGNHIANWASGIYNDKSCETACVPLLGYFNRLSDNPSIAANRRLKKDRYLVTPIRSYYHLSGEQSPLFVQYHNDKYTYSGTQFVSTVNGYGLFFGSIEWDDYTDNNYIDVMFKKIVKHDYLLVPDALVNPSYYSLLFSGFDIKYTIRIARCNELFYTFSNKFSWETITTKINDDEYYKIKNAYTYLYFNHAFSQISSKFLSFDDIIPESLLIDSANIGLLNILEGTSRSMYSNGNESMYLSTKAGDATSFNADIIFLDYQNMNNANGNSGFNPLECCCNNKYGKLSESINYVTRGIYSGVVALSYPLSSDIKKESSYIADIDWVDNNLYLDNDRTTSYSYYNIYKQGYSEAKTKEYFVERIQTNGGFYPITERYSITWLKDSNARRSYIDSESLMCPIPDTNRCINGKMSNDKNQYMLDIYSLPTNYVVRTYGGDCYIGLFANRMHRNFDGYNKYDNDFTPRKIDTRNNSNLVPDGNISGVTNVLQEGARLMRYDDDEELYGTYEVDGGTATATDRNLLNGVNLENWNRAFCGYWTITPFVSNYNLSLRNIVPGTMDDPFRNSSFFPNRFTLDSYNKVEDSHEINHAYHTLTNAHIKSTSENLNNPNFVATNHSTRIRFSELHSTDFYENAYRKFNMLNYFDYNNAYGKIIRILEFHNNCIVVFETGVGIVRINERLQTAGAVGDEVYIRSPYVLSKNLIPLSEIFGATWSNAVVKSDYYIYGIDVQSKRIWRTNGKEFKTISDFKIQQKLSEHISDYLINERPLLVEANLNESSGTEIGIRDVQSYYDKRKGDVHFCIYYGQLDHGKDFRDDGYDNILHFVYNEKSDFWTTRNTWYPAFCVSVNDKFYSFNQSVLKSIDGNTSLELWRHGYDGDNNGLEKSYDKDNKEEPSIMPNRWYKRLESDAKTRFEFEFVVSKPIGIQKIFHNLKFISNHVKPDELVIEIIGDGYDFDKNTFNETLLDSALFDSHTDMEYDFRTHEQKLVIHQKVVDIEEAGRVLGNAYYKEDAWDIQLRPIDYIEEVKEIKNGVEVVKERLDKQALIRDKYAKIRVIYTGEELPVITAIKTAFTVSHA